MTCIVLIAAWLGLTLAPTPPVDLSGTWNVTMPADVQRRPDGGKSEWKAMKGTLTVTQNGNELQATWRSIDAWVLTGRADATGRFALESEVRDIPMTHNGRAGTAPAQWLVRGQLRAGALSGTAALAVGDREPVFHPWTATRK